MWLSVDPLANYNPFMDDEFYIDGDHNGGVFNHFNHNSYGYCYQSPVKLIDPNGKQSISPIINGSSSSQPFHDYNDNFSYTPTRASDGVPIIDDTNQAWLHYQHGNGENVRLGNNTRSLIRNSDDIKRYRNNIVKGITSSPSRNIRGTGDGLEVDMTWEDSSTFHLGNMSLNYSTICNDKTCTTTYIVDDRGFVDPNFMAIFSTPDNEGDNMELVGGDTYDYEPVIWRETYKNPGYKFDKNGVPMSIAKDDTQN